MTWREILPPILFFLAFVVAGIVIGFYTGPFGGERRGDKARLACDRYVEILLTSTDQTEIIRAGIIVREMPCNIFKRILEN